MHLSIIEVNDIKYSLIRETLRKESYRRVKATLIRKLNARNKFGHKHSTEIHVKE